MNTTYTPSPWTLTDEPNPLVAGSDGAYVAQVLAYDVGADGTLRDNYAADAALIAAAPDLLATLISIQTTRPRDNHGRLSYKAAHESVLRQARAAIARATGAAI